MELVAAEQLPEARDLVVRVRPGSTPVRERREQLDVVQQDLARPVGALDRGLRGVRPAVILEVQLADEDRPVGGLTFERREELLAGTLGRARHPLEIADASEHLQHLPDGASATIAVAVQQEARVRAVVLLVVACRSADLLHGGDPVVGVGRREMGQDAAPVDALPEERVVRRPVEAVPGELLGEEPLDARSAHDLRQLAVVAEHVRVPELAAAPAELALEERLPEQELPDERLAGGDVAVRLDPGTSHGNELPARDALPDPLVQVGVALLDPGVLLRLGAGEPVLGIRVHVRGLRAERPDALPVRLRDRPEPGGIDVRVSDRGDLVAVVAVPLGIERCQLCSGLRPASAILRSPDVAEAVQLVEQLPRERRVEAPGVFGLELP